MFDFFGFIVENWETILNVGLLIFLFGMVPRLTGAIRNAKEGVRESLTPLGFIVLLMMIILFILVRSFVINL